MTAGIGIFWLGYINLTAGIPNFNSLVTFLTEIGLIFTGERKRIGFRRLSDILSSCDQFNKALNPLNKNGKTVMVLPLLIYSFRFSSLRSFFLYLPHKKSSVTDQYISRISHHPTQLDLHLNTAFPQTRAFAY